MTMRLLLLLAMVMVAGCEYQEKCAKGLMWERYEKDGVWKPAYNRYGPQRTCLDESSEPSP